MIHLLPGIAIPEDELRFAASRSGGPGGQNVNKVSSRVTLTFDLRHSAGESIKTACCVSFLNAHEARN